MDLLLFKRFLLWITLFPNMLIIKGFILRVFPVNHSVCCDSFVAGDDQTIWLRLQTKPERVCLQLSCCAGKTEPGFPLVGTKTDITPEPLLRSSASLSEALQAKMCQQSPVQGKSPICQVLLSWYASVYLFNKRDTKTHCVLSSKTLANGFISGRNVLKLP